jgi:hypothetical protein
MTGLRLGPRGSGLAGRLAAGLRSLRTDLQAGARCTGRYGVPCVAALRNEQRGLPVLWLGHVNNVCKRIDYSANRNMLAPDDDNAWHRNPGSHSVRESWGDRRSVVSNEYAAVRDCTVQDYVVIFARSPSC